MTRLTLRETKRLARRYYDRLEQQWLRADREQTRALKIYAKRTCPLKVGSVVKHRDEYTGRIAYWRITEIFGVRGIGSEGPFWKASARQCKANGSLIARRTVRHFHEQHFKAEAIRA